MTEELIGQLGYVGIALILVLGGLGLPVPEEAPIILAAMLSRTGQMRWELALTACFAGVLLGGFFSAIAARRLHLTVEKGAEASNTLRLGLALIGGILVGFASRLAGGCTSGQALTGGALLANGSLVFVICVFAGGYATAWFVRRQWND